MKKLLVVCLFIVSCSFKSPYVGNVYDTSSWCQNSPSSLPCVYKTEYVNFMVEKLYPAGRGKYSMSGTMVIKNIPNALKSISIGGSSFYLILARDDAVVETKNFLPKDAKSNTMFPFSLDFKSPPFDSYNFSYQFTATEQDFYP